MFTIIVVALSFLAALLRGGRLRENVPGVVFPLLAVAIQVPLSRLFPGTAIGRAAVIAGYLLLLPFLWLNRRSVGLMLVAAGLLLNLTVISANGGRMPVDNARVAAMGVRVPEGELAKHQPLTAGTMLPFLGDVIPLPPLPEVVSAGDLILAAGAFLFVQEIMGLPRRRRPLV